MALRRGKNKKDWNELGALQKMAVAMLAVVQVSLLGYALWDIRHRDAEEIRGPKALWTAIAFVNYVGPISYFIFGRRR